MAEIEVTGGSATPDNPKGAAGRPPHTERAADYEPAVEPGEDPMADEKEPAAPSAAVPRSGSDELSSTRGPALDRPLGRIPKPAAEPEQTPEEKALNERYHTLNPFRPEFLQRAAAAIEEQPGLGPLAHGVQALSDWAQGASQPSASPVAQPGYNFLDYIPPGFLEDYGQAYVHTENPAQAAEVTARIREHLANQAVLARSGWTGQAASFAAGTIDPMNIAAMALVPEAAPTRLGNAVRWALTNAAATGAQEAIRASEDDTYRPRDAVFNVSASAVLGGILGPLARRVPKADLEHMADGLHHELYPSTAVGLAEDGRVFGSAQRSVADELDSHLAGLEEAGFKDGYIPPVEKERPIVEEAAAPKVEQPKPEELKEWEHSLPGEPMYLNPTMESTAGAMAVHGGSLADMDVARGGKLYSKTVGRVSVAARLMESQSPAVRRLTMDLMNLPGTLEGHYRDIASPNPIERILWQEVDAKQAAAISKMNEQFGSYVKRVRGEGGVPLNRTGFEEQWARAMRRGDKSHIPEVATMARWQRENILNPYWERAKTAGTAPEDAQLYADSYLTRLYDIPKIRENKASWLELLQKSFMKHGVEDPLEARQIAHDVDRNISSGEKNTMDWHALDGIVPKSGRLKNRQLPFTDETLEPFLSSNHSELTRAYLHSIVPEVNMVERFGTRDLADQFQAIRDEYTHLIELAQGDSAKIRAIEKSRDSELNLLQAARDQLYGIYGVPRDPAAFFIRAGRDLRGLNVGRMLGGATFKHFPDLANEILVHGAPQTMAVLGKLATSLEAIKMGYAEARRMGAANDMVMNLSSSRLWDAPAHSTFWEQRALNKFNRFFTIATLETPVITAMQSISSISGSDQILRYAERLAAGRVLPKNRAAALAAAGLDSAMLERIHAANLTHGRQINGLKFGMSDRWADKEAARAFESAVIRDAHGVTMRPGIGDKPLFMSKEWGKFVFQFKSFEFAASRIVGLPMLQGLAHGDARAAQALLAQFAMAMLGYVAYQKAVGGRVETDPKKLIVELMDRTNLTGWTGSVIFPALYAIGFKDLSRWYDKDPISSVGPSAELVKEILDRRLLGRAQQSLTGQLPGQEGLGMRRSDLHFMRKMFPGNQLWYARHAADNLEDAIGDTFDLPGISLAERHANDESRGGVTIQ